VNIRVGDFLRSIVAPHTFLGKILQWTKGISIRRGKTTIHLNEDHGPAKPGESRFDRTPHRPGPGPR